MKQAIVMGASSGIGLEVVKELIKHGWKVGIAARRTKVMYELKQAYPLQIEVAQIDVTSVEAADQLLRLARRMGYIDLYFHASGVGRQNLELDVGTEMETLETNVLGFANLVDVMFLYMRNQNAGHIAVISSIAGVKGLGVAPSYSASKAFQNTYIQALEQLSNNLGLNIRFTDIRPGFVDTALLAGTNYPMRMKPKRVAEKIVCAIEKRRHVKIIDFRYVVLVSLWRLIPNMVWRKIKLF